MWKISGIEALTVIEETEWWDSIIPSSVQNIEYQQMLGKKFVRSRMASRHFNWDGFQKRDSIETISNKGFNWDGVRKGTQLRWFSKKGFNRHGFQKRDPT